jgi:hypothetical protein
MADSLLFDGTDDRVVFDGGDFAGNPPDAFSCFAIIKRGSDAGFDGVAYGGEVGEGGKFGFSIRATEELLSDTNHVGGQGEDDAAGALGTTTTQIQTAMGWVLCGYTKPAGENATPRFHRYRFDLEAWAHEAGTGGIQQNSCSGVFDELVAGAWKDVGAFGDFFVGNILLVGFWDTDLGNDAAVEAALTPDTTAALLLQTWVDAAPLELLRLDTAGAIEATVGSATEQARTGTSVDSGDSPVGWDDTLGTPQAVLPDADTVVTGWTSTPIFSKVNDASDATVVQATLA